MTFTPWRQPYRLISAFIGSIFAVTCGAARADVIQVGFDGAQTVFNRPAVYLDGLVTPIDSPAPASKSLAPETLRPVFAQAAQRHEVDLRLLEAVAWAESRFRQDAISPKGAVGVMQLMSGTAAALGVDPRDPLQNIEGGAAYLAAMMRRYGGDLTLALAAYNSGPGAVDRHGGVPPFAETRTYVRTILSRLAPTPVPAVTVTLIAP